MNGKERKKEKKEKKKKTISFLFVWLLKREAPLKHITCWPLNLSSHYIDSITPFYDPPKHKSNKNLNFFIIIKIKTHSNILRMCLYYSFRLFSKEKKIKKHKNKSKNDIFTKIHIKNCTISYI